MISKLSLLLSIAILLATPLSHADKQATQTQSDATWLSANHTTQLIELYTSEGCSSCPPADRWLSALQKHPRLWQDFIPVAFHVDYWDYIGWKDPFADPAHAKRQRLHATLGHSRGVYTPGFFLHGEEWRPTKRQLPDLNARKPAIAQLQLTATDNHFTLNLLTDDTQASKGLNAHLVLLGMARHSDVTRGENAGKNLQHDFVVLEHLKTNSKHPERNRWQFSPAWRLQAGQQYAIAAWLEDSDTLMPLQAVGGWLQP